MYREEVLNLRNPYTVNKLSDFLMPLGFHYDPGDVDYTMVLYDSDDAIAGTGSYQGNVLKYVVVAPEDHGNCIVS